MVTTPVRLILTPRSISLSAGQGGQADDLLLHPSHALCPPQPRPLRGDRGEAEHAQQADQDCEAVTEVERLTTTTSILFKLL